MIHKNSFIYFIPLVVIVCFLTSLFLNDKKTTSLSQPKKMLAYFYLPSLFDPRISLSNQDLQGKVAILNIWGSWCPLCQAEHPVLMKIKERYGISIYGINIKDTVTDAKKWLQKAGNPYVKVGMDFNGQTIAHLGILGVPVTIILENGFICHQYVGILDEEAFKNKLLPFINGCNIINQYDKYH